MNGEDLPPLDRDVDAFLAAERPLTTVDASQRLRALGAVEGMIAAGAVPDTASTMSQGGAVGSGVAATNGGAFVLVGGKAALAIVSAFVVGAIAGGVGVLGVTGNRAPDSAPPSASTPSTAVAFSAVPTPIASTMTALPPAVSSSNAPTITVTDLPEAAFTKPAQSAPPISGSGLAAERALLDVARAALGRGSPEEALEAAMRHAREYPSGVLTEEREALAIRALAASGNRDAAVARASRFRSRYPKSLLLPAVEGATR